VVIIQRRTLQVSGNTDVVVWRTANVEANSSLETIVLEPNTPTAEAPPAPTPTPTPGPGPGPQTNVAALAPNVAPVTWTDVGLALGAQALSSGIRALVNEHNSSIQRRQLEAETVAFRAQSNARFWDNMLSLGATGAQMAVRYYLS